MYLIISNDDNNVMSIYTNYIYYYMLEEQKKNDGMKIRMRIEHTIKKKNLPIFIQKIDARKRRSLIQPNNQTERRIVLTTTRQQPACKTMGRDYPTKHFDCNMKHLHQPRSSYVRRHTSTCDEVQP